MTAPLTVARADGPCVVVVVVVVVRTPSGAWTHGAVRLHDGAALTTSRSAEANPRAQAAEARRACSRVARQALRADGCVRLQKDTKDDTTMANAAAAVASLEEELKEAKAALKPLRVAAARARRHYRALQRAEAKQRQAGRVPSSDDTARAKAAYKAHRQARDRLRRHEAPDRLASDLKAAKARLYSIRRSQASSSTVPSSLTSSVPSSSASVTASSVPSSSASQAPVQPPPTSSASSVQQPPITIINGPVGFEALASAARLDPAVILYYYDVVVLGGDPGLVVDGTFAPMTLAEFVAMLRRYIYFIHHEGDPPPRAPPGQPPLPHPTEVRSKAVRSATTEAANARAREARLAAAQQCVCRARLVLRGRSDTFARWCGSNVPVPDHAQANKYVSCAHAQPRLVFSSRTRAQRDRRRRRPCDEGVERPPPGLLLHHGRAQQGIRDVRSACARCLPGRSLIVAAAAQTTAESGCRQGVLRKRGRAPSPPNRECPEGQGLGRRCPRPARACHCRCRRRCCPWIVSAHRALDDGRPLIPCFRRSHRPVLPIVGLGCARRPGLLACPDSDLRTATGASRPPSSG